MILHRLCLAGGLTAVLGVSGVCAADQVILVRHAEKQSAAERDPTLSAAGQSRAQALAEALADARISTVLVTPFQRTRDTAAPLAQRLGLVPREVAVSGGLEAHVRAVTEAVGAAAGVALVVGHSNTVPALVKALGGPDLPELCETSYSQVFVLTRTDQGVSLQRWRYGLPDAPPQAGCL